MKNKINFLWNTALSMLDIGSSLIYNLLGRNLDATDIELIEKIFTHMSTVKSIETEYDDDENNNNILNLIEFEQMKSRRLLSLIERLNKGKDILLITNNGYNLLQISVLNMLSCSFNLIECELDLNEIPFVSLFNARLNIIRSLLEYGCDPNRGIGFLNDKKLKHSENINNNSNNDYNSDYDDISDTETVVNKIHNDSNHHHNHHHYQQQSKLAITPIDTPLLLFVCLYNCHNLLDYSSIVSSNNNNNTENEQNSLNNSSSSSIATSISTDYDKLNKRRHTIQALHISSSKMHSMAYKKQGSSSINIKSTIGDKSDSDNWPSRSIDKYSSSSSSIDDQDLDNDELSLHDNEDAESISSSCSSYSSGCYQDLKITNNSNLITSPNKTFDSNRNYASSEMSDYSEDEEDDDDADDDNSFNNECNKTDHENKPNIYNYDFEVDDQNYFDKYDIDIDSKCCKLFTNDFETIAGSTMTHQQFGMEHFENDLINQKMSSLSTSIFSIPSSSIQTINMTSSLIATNPITTTTTSSDLNKLTELARTNYKKRYIYEQLNKQRLNLLDLLLEHGADKYLVGSISKSNISQMNKKTYNMLSKWFSQTTNNGGYSLRSMSPIIASICLDDVEVFSRLYSHHQMLFNYFKPNEDYELIYYAIRFQSKKCLIYLLSYLNTKDEITTTSSSSSSSSSFKLRNSVSLPSSLSKQCSIHNQFDTINKNINTMFYILENTRSSKIISVLLKCGFDLTKRDPTTGNTVLHCLFHSAKLTTSTNQSILKEFNTPRSLSKILFKLLKNGGLKAFVNTPNYAHKVCTQSLFEWNELINTCFFQSTSNEFKWKYELEECVRLLLKSGADMFTTTSDETHEINCILNLIETIHKNSLDRPCYQNEFYHHDSITKSSNSETNISQILNNSTSKSSQIFAKAKKMLNTTTTNNSRSNNSKNNIETETNKTNKFNVKRQCQLNKRLDIKYLFNLLNNVIDLPNMISNLNRKKYKFYHQNDSFNNNNNNNNQSSNFNYIPGESIISKYLEIIQNVNLDEFETAFKLFKLLCRLEKQLVKKRVLNYVSPQVIKTLINNWILDPNLFSSNRQLDKNHFVKSIIIHLIANDMFDPNDSSTVYNSDHCLVSNNLLKHCVRLIFKSKTGYQLELIYDLMRTLIQYGANPNLEPYELVEKNFFSLRFEDCNNITNKSMSVLSQLCDCSHHNNVTNCQSPFNFKQKDNHLNSLSHINEHHYHHNNHNHHHYHHHHHHHHKNRHNYFNDYFNNKYYSHTRQERHELSNSNLMYSSLNPILLLTPSPSYDSLISLPLSQSNNCTYATTMSNNNNNNNSNNNIIIDKSILFLNHYKKFVKLLYDSMDNNTIKQCLKHKKNHYKHYYIRNYSVDTVEKQDGDHLAALKLYSVESLDMYLEKLASTPRTLKSIVRRHVLNQLIQNQKMNKSTDKLTAIAKQVEQLPLPRRIMDYLLFIE